MKIILLLLLLEFWVSTADSDPSKSPSTCDYDDRIKGEDHLSSACKEIKEKGGDLYKKAMQESNQFREFEEKLNKFEHKFANKIWDDEFWAAKLKFYKEAKFLDCYEEHTGEEFYNCIIKSRKEMMKAIDEFPEA